MRADPSQLPEIGDLVAHEVNNCLNNINLHAILLERGLTPEAREARRAELQVIRQAIHRAGELLQRWQAYTQREPARLQPLDLGRVAGEALAAWQREDGGGVTARAEPAAPARAQAVEEDLRQLVRQLATAARDAGARHITVRAEAAPWQAVLHVEDDGAPIEAAFADRVFEPFVTARGAPPADGLALGLAVCKLLARRQNATIAAANRPEGGVSVTVQFTAEAPA